MSNRIPKRLKRALRNCGFRWTSTRDDVPEVFVRKMLPGGITVEGVVGAPGGYPSNRPGIFYAVLCHDWDRRANASCRMELDPSAGLEKGLRAALEHLKLGYASTEDISDF